MKENNDFEVKPEPLTAVLQKLGFSANLNIWNTNEHCAKFEHSYF